jgi:cytochrome c553
MFKHERFLLCLIAVAISAGCGTPATSGPTLAPPSALPTRVPIQLTGSTPQPTAVAAQPTIPPTTAPVVTRAAANPSPTLIPVSPTRSFATATPKVVATATQAAAAGGAGGDPVKGQALFANGFGDPAVPACSTCHTVDTEEIKVGPSQKGVATHAIPHAQATGQDLPTYFHTSIVSPNAFLVPNQEGHTFAVGGTSLMFQDYAKHLTDQQINDLIAYLLTLK